VLQDARHVLVHKEPGFRGSYKVRNVHRNIGTRLAGEIAYLHGNKGLPEGLIDLTFEGSSGQSFGTFCVQGMRLRLVGEANDYVGKGMNGGEIILRPSPEASFAWHENIIMGNTCLYGATGGSLLAAGRAGERFCVRNSGATAVVEGVGDHGCEYMTGGAVVVLGPVGRNFGAGMSGGLAFVWDPERRLDALFNPEMVELRAVDAAESDALRALVTRHAEATGSPHAQSLLADWPKALSAFRRVTPIGSVATLAAPAPAAA
jgi:glutamate synthase (NADPH/NADH) large chain/glutamate synthase (ferredoxin)